MQIRRSRPKLFWALLAAAWLLLAAPAWAEPLVPVPTGQVERAVKAVLGAWNTPGFAATLAPEFPNRNALLATLATAPFDARIELLGLGGVQTLEQAREDAALVSLVRAHARIVLTYTDGSGFRREEGAVELILRLRREAPRR